MDNEYRKVRLWLIGESPKAYHFATLPVSNKDHKKVWLPKSQIKHVSKDPMSSTEDGRPCTVEVAEWLAENHGL